MKKIILCTFSILIILLSACSSTKEEKPVFYPIKYVYLDGELSESITGGILLGENSGTLIVDGNSCAFQIDEDMIKINSLEGKISLLGDVVTLIFPDINLEYIFSTNEISHLYEEEILPEIQETLMSGRLYFKSAEGKYSEYEGRSLSVEGYKSDSGYKIFSDSYSNSEPILLVDENCDGLFMDYEVICSVKSYYDTESSIIERYDIADPFKYRPWDATSGYYDQEDEEVEITLIQGNCKDSFDFEIYLVQTEENN